MPRTAVDAASADGARRADGRRRDLAGQHAGAAGPVARAGRTVRARRPRAALSVQYAASGDDLPARPLLRRWVRAALGTDVAAVTIVLRFVETAESRALNRCFRNRDRPTNVLAFVYDAKRGPEGPIISGDIVLCAPVLRREASKQGKMLEAHCAHLVVHGVLHLQGYDHDLEGEAARMEAREIAILAGLGFANPYRPESGIRAKPSRLASR
jgi:probable rRNA maturation factor